MYEGGLSQPGVSLGQAPCVHVCGVTLSHDMKVTVYRARVRCSQSEVAGKVHR